MSAVFFLNAEQRAAIEQLDRDIERTQRLPVVTTDPAALSALQLGDTEVLAILSSEFKDFPGARS